MNDTSATRTPQPDTIAAGPDKSPSLESPSLELLALEGSPPLSTRLEEYEIKERELRLQKLDLEILHLNKPWWKTPSVFMGSLPALLGLATLFYAYRTGYFDLKSEVLALQGQRLELRNDTLTRHGKALMALNESLVQDSIRLVGERSNLTLQQDTLQQTFRIQQLDLKSKYSLLQQSLEKKFVRSTDSVNTAILEQQLDRILRGLTRLSLNYEVRESIEELKVFYNESLDPSVREIRKTLLLKKASLSNDPHVRVGIYLSQCDALTPDAELQKAILQILKNAPTPTVTYNSYFHDHKLAPEWLRLCTDTLFLSDLIRADWDHDHYAFCVSFLNFPLGSLGTLYPDKVFPLLRKLIQPTEFYTQNETSLYWRVLAVLTDLSPSAATYFVLDNYRDRGKSFDRIAKESSEFIRILGMSAFGRKYDVPEEPGLNAWLGWGEQYGQKLKPWKSFFEGGNPPNMDVIIHLDSGRD